MSIWCIQSEKNRSTYLTPHEMNSRALIIIIGLEEMHFGHFCPPWLPGASQWGGGPVGPKIAIFRSHIWVLKCEILDCMN